MNTCELLPNTNEIYTMQWKVIQHKKNIKNTNESSIQM